MKKFPTVVLQIVELLGWVDFITTRYYRYSQIPFEAIGTSDTMPPMKQDIAKQPHLLGSTVFSPVQRS
jgi:hypothetical protein